MSKIVMGVSDWPEDLGKEFEICSVMEGETDDEAIIRAKSYYSPDLECFISEEVMKKNLFGY